MDNHLDSFEFDEESERFCDELASHYFEDIKKRTKITKFRSIQYVEKRTRDILLVCVNGSILYTPADLGAAVNSIGFECGVRSDPEALIRLKNSRRWELALN